MKASNPASPNLVPNVARRSCQTELIFIRFNSAERDRRYSHLPPKNEKTTQATSGLLFTARRLVKLSGDQGFQAPVVYSVIKNPKNPPQSSRAFVFRNPFLRSVGEEMHVIRVNTNLDFRLVGNRTRGLAEGGLPVTT